MSQRLPTILAAAAAAAFSLNAQAGGPTTADYAKVVLYADVTIAQDSPESWGIWEQLEPTAAGPQTPLPLIASRSEPYRPLGIITPVTPTTPEKPAALICSAGNLCGFGVIQQYDRSEEGPSALRVSEATVPDRMGFMLVASEVEPATGKGWLPQSFKLTTQGINGEVPTFEAYGPMTLGGGNNHFREFMNDEGTVYEEGYISTELGRVRKETGTGTTADPFTGSLSRYVRGNAQTEESTGLSVSMYGVWGITTSADDMAAMLRNKVTATYTGFAIGPDNNRTSAVRMNVDFGNQTFTGSFNRGADGPGVKVLTTASGATQLQGRVGFEMSGTIGGSNWSATSFSARDAVSVTGAASGAFFGPQAAAMGGVVDIVKTQKILDPNTEAKPYVNARYVAPFIAVKQDLTPR